MFHIQKSSQDSVLHVTDVHVRTSSKDKTYYDQPENLNRNTKKNIYLHE